MDTKLSKGGIAVSTTKPHKYPAGTAPNCTELKLSGNQAQPLFQKSETLLFLPLSRKIESIHYPCEGRP